VFKRFRAFQQNEFIVAFADLSMGGADNTAVQFLSAKWLDQPQVFHAHVTGSYMTPLLHEELTRISVETGVKPVVAFERNNGGGFEMDRLARLNRYGDYEIYTMKAVDPTGRVVDTGKLGFDTNLATRPKMLQELKDAIESDLLHLYHRQTVSELFSFIIKPNGRPEAEDSAHDDLVMALAGAWQLYQSEKPRKDQGSSVIETSNHDGQYKEAGILVAEEEFYA
jgi:hypothetical protein